MCTGFYQGGGGVFLEELKIFVVDFCIFKSTETRLLIVVVSLIPPATLTNNKYMCIVRSQKQLDQWAMLSRFYAIFQLGIQNKKI